MIDDLGQPGPMPPQPEQPQKEPLKLQRKRKGAVKKAQTRGYKSVLFAGHGSWVRRLPIFDERVIEEMLRDDMITLCLKMRAAPISAVEFAYRDLHNDRWVPGVRASREEIGVFVLRQLHRIWQYLDYILEAQVWGHSAGEITLRHTRYGTVELDKLLPRRAPDCRVLTRGGQPVGVRVTGVPRGYVDLTYPYCWWHAYDPIPGSNYGRSALYPAQSPWWDKWMEGGALDTQRLFMHTNAYGGVDIAYPAGKTHIDGRGLVDNYEIAYDMATQVRTGSVTTRPSERDDKGNEKWVITRGQVASNPQHIHDWPDKCDDRIRTAMGVPDDVITSDGGTGAWAGKRIPMAAFFGSLDSWVSRILCDFDPIIKHLVELNFGKSHWYELEHRPMAEQAMEDQQGGDPNAGMGGMDPMDPMDPMGGMDPMDPMGGMDPMDPMGGMDPMDPMGGMGPEDDQEPIRMSLSLKDEDGEDAMEKARLMADVLADIFGEDVDSVLEELLGVQRMSLGRQWNADDHPRGKDGRFIKKGTEEGYNAAAAAVTHVRKNRKDTEARKGLMGHLKNLTVKQLHQLKRANGVKASGRVRADLVEKLAERLGNYRYSVEERDNQTPVSPHVDMVYAVPLESLDVDPKRFQYKVEGVRADGVTDKMREVTSWNPLLGGTLLVWRDPETGEDFIVNGHHRFELAKRAGQDILNVRYIDADNAKEARAQGALANIAEGQGTAVDAAKFLRDSGISISDLKKHGVSLKGKIAEDALILQDVSDSTFQKVAEGRLDVKTAIAVAKHLKDHKLQEALLKRINDREEVGQVWNERQMEQAAKKMSNAGMVKETTQSLFGDWEDEKSTFDDEVELEEFIASRLKTQKFDFAAVGNAKRYQRIADAGNVLAIDENLRRKQEVESLLDDFERESKYKGPVADKIKEIAGELSQISGKTARKNFIESRYQEVLDMLGPEGNEPQRPNEPAQMDDTTPAEPPAAPKVDPAVRDRLISSAEKAIEKQRETYRNAIIQGEPDLIELEKKDLVEKESLLNMYQQKLGIPESPSPEKGKGAFLRRLEDRISGDPVLRQQLRNGSRDAAQATFQELAEQALEDSAEDDFEFYQQIRNNPEEHKALFSELNDYRNNLIPKPQKSIFDDENRQYMDVPFSAKETAKEMGAHWDPKQKRWFTFTQESANRIRELLDGSTYNFARANGNEQELAKLDAYEKSYGRNSKMVQLVADEIRSRQAANRPAEIDTSQFPDEWASTPVKAKTAAKILFDQGVLTSAELDPVWNDYVGLVNLVDRKISPGRARTTPKNAKPRSIDDLLNSLSE